MNKIFRDGFYSIFAAIINLVVALGSSILIARLLGPEGKGIITLAVQVAAFGSILCTFGLSLAYQYSLGKNIISLEEVNGHILVQTLLIVALMIILMLVGGENSLRAITKSSLSHNVLIMAIALLILNTVATYLNGPLMALKDGVKLSSLYSIAGTLLYGLSIVLLIWILKWEVLGVLVANILGVCMRILFSWHKIFTSALKTIRFNWLKNSRPLYIYGLSTMVGQLMLTGLLRIDTFIVNAYLGSGPLGIYSVAYTLAELLLLVPRGFGLAIFPQMNSASKQDQINMMATTARVNLILMLLAAGLLVLGGYPAIRFMFGPKFEPAFVALLWILPGVLAMSLTYSSYHYFFSSTGRPYILAIIYGLGTLFNSILNLFLIPKMGISGASLTSSITYILITIGLIFMISRQEKLPVSKLILFEKGDFHALSRAITKITSRLKVLTSYS